MGRGALAKVRWKNDRIRKKKARDKRTAESGGARAEAAANTNDARVATGAETSSE